jgi:hypothetical protein
MHRNHRLFWKGLVSLLLALIWVVASVMPAFADIYHPPRLPAGSGITPENEQTQVRMMYENVFMDIGVDDVAKVDANFVMRNLGDKEEQMEVYFPLYTVEVAHPDAESCGEGVMGKPIGDLAVWVWDKPQPIRTDWLPRYQKYVNPSPNDEKVPCWGVFAAVFPPGIDVPIEVKYTSPSYSYVLITGASWHGTIGQADITIRLPYAVVQDQNLDWCYPKSCTLNGRDIQWKFMDFEPEVNLDIEIVPPNAWWRILTETNNLKLNPKDSLAVQRLAIAYADSVLSASPKYTFIGYYGFSPDPGNQWRYKLSVETLRKAIALNSGDFNLHYQLADLICTNVQWPKWTAYLPGDPDAPDDMTSEEQYHAWFADWVECAQQLKQSLDIDPKNPDALKRAFILSEFNGHYGGQVNAIQMKGDRPDFLILTPGAKLAIVTLTPEPAAPSPAVQAAWATNVAYLTENAPTITPTPMLTTTPAFSTTPTFTTIPTFTTTPIPTPPIPETGSGNFWAWGLIPLVAILALVMLRRRNGS